MKTIVEKYNCKPVRRNTIADLWEIKLNNVHSQIPFPAIWDPGSELMQRWLRAQAYAAESSLGLVGRLRNVPFVWNIEDEKEEDDGQAHNLFGFRQTLTLTHSFWHFHCGVAFAKDAAPSSGNALQCYWRLNFHPPLLVRLSFHVFNICILLRSWPLATHRCWWDNYQSSTTLLPLLTLSLPPDLFISRPPLLLFFWFCCLS